MTDLSKEQMDDVAWHVAQFRSHESYVQAACRKLSDAASFLRGPQRATYCDLIKIPLGYFDAMRLIGDNEAGFEDDENEEAPSSALEISMLMIATADELEQVKRVAVAAETGGWKAAIPMLVELRRIRDPDFGREGGLPGLR
jgi:hypothetical protein